MKARPGTSIEGRTKAEMLESIGRWTPTRKYELVDAIQRGILSRSEVTAAHGISEVELRSWERTVTQKGVSGLRVSKQENRRYDKD